MYVFLFYWAKKYNPAPERSVSIAAFNKQGVLITFLSNSVTAVQNLFKNQTLLI